MRRNAFLCAKKLDLYAVYAIGFLGQALFGARLIVQLFLSERARKVVSPVVFWQLSLGGSFIFLVYGLLRQDAIIIFGQTISYYIYVRNLQLKNAWTTIPAVIRGLLWILPIAVMTATFSREVGFTFLKNPNLLHPVAVLGAIGQLALNLRFVYQWYYSERRGTSVLPLAFWHISTWASVLVIIYAIYNPLTGKADPVLLVSQSLGIFVYIRNVIIYHRGGSEHNAQ